MNWMLDEVVDIESALALNILEHILIGTPAAPLYKALIDSGLGQALAGGGLDDGLRQPMISIGRQQRSSLSNLSDLGRALIQPNPMSA